MKPLVFIILISMMFLVAGCSHEDCSLKNTIYQKYSWDSNKSECVVSQTIEKNVCGNGVIENGETYCNCPKDVLKTNPQYGCEGTVGDYLQKSCNSQKQCALMQNDKVVSQTKSIELKNSDLTFEGNFKLNYPFILKTDENDKVQIQINLFNTLSTGADIKNIEVRSLKIEDFNSIVFANVNYNQKISMNSPNLDVKAVSLSETSKYDTKENLRIKLVVSYTKDYKDTKGNIVKTENKIETLTGSLGSWEIINPNFYEAKKR